MKLRKPENTRENSSRPKLVEHVGLHWDTRNGRSSLLGQLEKVGINRGEAKQKDARQCEKQGKPCENQNT